MEYSLIAVAVSVVTAAISIFTFVSQKNKVQQERGKLDQSIEQANSTATIALAKAEFAASNLAEYKTKVAAEFVSVAAVNQIEQRIVSEVHRVSDDMKAGASEIAKRFDQLAVTLIESFATAAASSKPPSRRK